MCGGKKKMLTAGIDGLNEIEVMPVMVNWLMSMPTKNRYLHVRVHASSMMSQQT